MSKNRGNRAPVEQHFGHIFLCVYISSLSPAAVFFFFNHSLMGGLARQPNNIFVCITALASCYDSWSGERLALATVTLSQHAFRNSERPGVSAQSSGGGRAELNDDCMNSASATRGISLNQAQMGYRGCWGVIDQWLNNWLFTGVLQLLLWLYNAPSMMLQSYMLRRAATRRLIPHYTFHFFRGRDITYYNSSSRCLLRRFPTAGWR